MATHSEIYGHAEMSNDELEERISSDLFELSERLTKNSKTENIGNLLWSLMGNIREGYRTAKRIAESA